MRNKTSTGGSNSTATITSPQAISVPKEAWLAATLALAFAYIMFSENGVLLTQNWEAVHEFFHDGRHTFGVPCH